MDALLPIVLQFLAGTVTALVLGGIWRALGLGVAGALTLGGLGGVVVGELRGHITGAHHHMGGQDMPGMTMAPATDLSTILLNVAWGAGGGAFFLLLAFVVRRLVPD